MTIRLLQPSDSIEELTELLHRAYKELADMGFRYVATYQSPDVTRERIRDVECWVAVGSPLPQSGSSLREGVGGGRSQAASSTPLPPSFPSRRDSEADTNHSEEGEAILGTIAFHDAAQTAGCPWYGRPEVASFHQFAVDPSRQRMGIGSALLDKAEQRARETGAGEIALDTSEGAHHLIALYERRGYRHIETVQWDVTNYRSVIMSKALP